MSEQVSPGPALLDVAGLKVAAGDRLLLDDITVHADDGRLPRLAELVAAVAVDHQVLVFTSQDATVQQLRSATPDTRLVSLDPGTAAAPSIGLAVS